MSAIKVAVGIISLNFLPFLIIDSIGNVNQAQETVDHQLYISTELWRFSVYYSENKFNDMERYS